MWLGKILERYILREVVTAWLVVTGVLLVILLANQVAGCWSAPPKTSIRKAWCWS